MDKISFTVVLHNHIDGVDTHFANISGPLAKNLLGVWLVLIVRGAYDAAAGNIMWAYEPISEFWLVIDLVSDSSDKDSGEEKITDQDNSKYQVEEKYLVSPHRNPIALIQI